MPNIYKYIIIGSLLFLFGQNSIVGQSQKKVENLTDTTTTSKLWQGLMVEVDVAPILKNLITKNDIFVYKTSFQANLKNRYFPVVELGFSDTKKQIKPVNFKGNGTFGKVGLDFNLLKNKISTKRLNNYALGGVRLAYSRTSYSILNQIIEDEYWGSRWVIDKNDQTAHKLWVEVVIGLRASIYKNIYMGWNIRSKHMLTRDKSGKISSWYISGFGVNDTSNWGFNYIIGYRF